MKADEIPEEYQFTRESLLSYLERLRAFALEGYDDKDAVLPFPDVESFTTACIEVMKDTEPPKNVIPLYVQ